jgi:ketosteroid isomerase-like protein
MVTTKALGFALLVSVAAPDGGAEVMEKAQRDDVLSAVSARVRSFATAERARDAEQLLAHYASGPECHFYHDGRRANYDVIAGGVRKALPGVRSLEVAYDDVEVTVLSAEYALASATFRRDVVIDSTGAAVRQEGGVSWIWRNMDGKWLIVHGHISHPLAPAK